MPDPSHVLDPAALPDATRYGSLLVLRVKHPTQGKLAAIQSAASRVWPGEVLVTDETVEITAMAPAPLPPRIRRGYPDLGEWEPSVSPLFHPDKAPEAPDVE